MKYAVTPRAVLAAILAIGVSSAAMAQDAKKPAPAAAPKAAAPAAPAAAPAAAAPAASAPAGKQSAWVKLCEKATLNKSKDGKDVKEEKNICLTHHERLDGNTGMVIVSAALREIEGNDKKQFMIMVPLGMAIPPGLRAAVYTKEMWDKASKNEKIDEKLLKPIDLKFSLCHPAGCTAEVEASKEMVDGMKAGGGVMVLALDSRAQPIGFPVPLDGFNEAITGAPVNNEEYSKARGELMGRIRQHQQEMIEKMKEEQFKNLPPNPATAAAPGAPAPAPAAAAAAAPKK